MVSGVLSKKFKDLTGQVFGHLKVLSFDSWHIQPSGQKKAKWRCLCECGKESITSGVNLSTGHTLSCGCLFKKKATKHGRSNTDTYNIYYAMLHRCYKEGNDKYRIYGGAGVEVCDRWLESFENFLEDMGERPKGMSINRVHGSKIYSKETCEWATTGEQSFDLRVAKVSSSGCTGVHITRHGTFGARIGHEGKIILLGTYKTFEEARSARLLAEVEYYGYNKPTNVL